MSKYIQNNSKDTGNRGEQDAKKHLVKKGYKILAMNWRYKKLEVDIIARDGATMVFVEVKIRKDNAFGEPEMFVSKQKQKFLIAAAQQYLEENQIDQESRFDIVGIIG